MSPDTLAAMVEAYQQIIETLKEEREYLRRKVDQLEDKLINLVDPNAVARLAPPPRPSESPRGPSPLRLAHADRPSDDELASLDREFGEGFATAADIDAAFKRPE